MTVYAWHFVGPKLRDGRPVPADGKWLKHTGAIELCVAGLARERASVRRRRGDEMSITPIKHEPAWWVTKDGDLDRREMYERHYSCYYYRDGRRERNKDGAGVE